MKDNRRINRLMKVTNSNTQQQLASFLGISQAAVSKASQRNSIPMTWVTTAFVKMGVNPDYILFGRKPIILVKRT